MIFFFPWDKWLCCVHTVFFNVFIFFSTFFSRSKKKKKKVQLIDDVPTGLHDVRLDHVIVPPPLVEDDDSKSSDDENRPKM